MTTARSRQIAVPRQLSVVLACIGAVILLQFHLVLTRAINWDEFWYYSQVEQYARGSLTSPLQTIHVHLFAWLTRLPGNGVDHIVVGRLGMFGAELVTLGAIWAVSSHFTDRRTGLICALAYIGSVYTFQHGFSFRVDPLAASLSMAALLVLLKSRLGPAGIGAFSLLLGLACMVTIKTALLAPAFTGIAWLRLAESEHPRQTLLRLTACAMSTAAVFTAIYSFHLATVAQVRAAGEPPVDSGAHVVKSAADYVFAIGLPIYSNYLLTHAVKSPLQTIFLLTAPLLVFRSQLNRERKIALAGLLATGLVFFFYRNTLPYFYAFILPPMLCGASLAMRAATQRYSLAFAAVALTLCPIAYWIQEPKSPIDKQRNLIAAADIIFPEPVAYFDFCAMLGKFEKANPFMTTWGIAGYRKADVPVMRERMRREVVPLVLASEQENFSTFRAVLASDGPSPYFVDEDAAALRDNYLPFWGPYWLAGKAVAASGGERAEEFLVPGPYTVRDAPVLVDGKVFHPGEVVRLARGRHALHAVGGRAGRLIWGDHLKAPRTAPPAAPYWTDF